MQPTTITQGQQLYDSKTGQSIGTVQYDTQTGKPLAAGQTTQYNLPTPTVTPTTTAVSIGTQPAYVPPTPTADSAFAELMAQQQSYQQESQRNYDAALAKDQAQETDVKNLQNQLLGQTADLQNFESQQGLPGLNSQAADLQALSQMQTAKYLEGYTQLEKSQTPLGLIQSGQNELTRQNGINALITNANISAVNGKIATAQAQVDRAMSLKYDPIKQQLENSLTFLQRYDNQLSESKQQLSEAKQQQLQLQIKQIEIQKANETAIQNIAIEAAKNGASAKTLAEIGKATSVAEATAKAAGYFQDPLDVQLKKLQIQSAKISIAKASQKTTPEQKIVKINGTDYIQNADGTFSVPNVPGSQNSAAAQQAVQEKLAQIQSIKDNPGLAQSVGSTALFGRGGTLFPGKKQDFIASVEQLRGELTLQNLIDSKAKGATFGALSDAELRLLANSASKIGTWAVVNKNGKVTGYQASEKSFQEELDNIARLTQQALAGSVQTDSYLNLLDSVLKTQDNPYYTAGYLTQ